MDFDANTLWQATLDELGLQMTEATFDTWLRDSRATTGLEDGVLVVSVKSEYARDWLESRLVNTVERTLARVVGAPVGVRFVAREVVEVEPAAAPPPGPPVTPPIAEEEAGAGFVLPDFDVHDAGWFPVSEYECRFWAPVLGRVAWRVWEIVRRADKRKKKTPWTPSRRWTAPALAAMVPCGKQAIVGVDRRVEEGWPGAWVDEAGVWRARQPGAFERLEGLGVAEVKRVGETRHTVYWVKVRVKLGILRPALVGELLARLQVQHDRWLEEHGFDPLEWVE